MLAKTGRIIENKWISFQSKIVANGTRVSKNIFLDVQLEIFDKDVYCSNITVHNFVIKNHFV